MSGKIYEIGGELSIPELASHREQDISISEWRRAERTSHGYPRVIGGDRGDLLFKGYTLMGDRTVLDNPALMTMLELTPDEAHEIALEILMESYESIGVECVEHN